MKPVLAVSGLLERAKQSAVVLVKGRRLQTAASYRCIHAGIIGWVAHVKNQLTGVKLHILVSGDVADFQLTGGHANKKPGVFWHFYDDSKVVSGTARHPQFGGVVEPLEEYFDLSGPLRVTGLQADRNLV